MKKEYVPTDFSCGDCRKNFKNRKAWMQHLRRVHLNKNNESESEMKIDEKELRKRLLTLLWRTFHHKYKNDEGNPVVPVGEYFSLWSRFKENYKVTSRNSEKKKHYNIGLRSPISKEAKKQ